MGQKDITKGLECPYFLGVSNTLPIQRLGSRLELLKHNGAWDRYLHFLKISLVQVDNRSAGFAPLDFGQRLLQGFTHKCWPGGNTPNPAYPLIKNAWKTKPCGRSEFCVHPHEDVAGLNDNFSWPMLRCPNL